MSLSDPDQDQGLSTDPDDGSEQQDSDDDDEGEEEEDQQFSAPAPPPAPPAPLQPVSGGGDNSVPSPSSAAADPAAAASGGSEPTPGPPPVPVLRGTLSNGPTGLCMLRGVWTMSETDTVSSAFEFVKRPGEVAPPSLPQPSDAPSDSASASAPTVHRAGDAATGPPNGLYDGFFMMKRLHAPEVKVLELGAVFTFRPLGAGEAVELPAACTRPQPGDWYFMGGGSNEFGVFELRGRYCPSTGEVVVGKVYTAPSLVATPVPGGKKGGKHASKGPSKRPAQPRPAATPKPRAPRPPAVPPTPRTASSSAAAAEAAEALQREQRKRNIPTHLREVFAPGKHTGPFVTCAKILDALMAHQFAYPFLVPVDPVALNIPDYPRVIKRPMDLGTVKHKLDHGAYMTHEEFAEDTRTTFLNAMAYNAPSTDVYGMADRLRKKFEEQWRLFGRLMDKEANELKHNAATAAAAGASNGGGGGGGGSARQSAGGNAHVAADDSDDEEHDGGAATKKGSGGVRVKSEGKSGAKAAAGAAGPGRKRVRPPADSKRASAASAPAPVPAAAPVVYVERGMGVSNSDVAELKSELQALRMQLRMMAAMTANVQMAAAAPVRLGELTYEEKRDLSMRINQLDGDKLAKVVQIIAERMPLGSHSASEDIEIDIDALEVDTLRRLQDFVKASLPKPKRAAAPAKTKGELLRALAQDSEANKMRLQAMEKQPGAGGMSHSGASTRPVGGYGSDSDSDSDADVRPPPPPGARF